MNLESECEVCGDPYEVTEESPVGVCLPCGTSPDLRTAWVPERGRWIFWHEPQLPLDITPEA